MLGLYVSVPVACFRKGFAREYLETEILPPPATCYGFLLSLVGETDRTRHIGCRIAPVLIEEPQKSLILRTVWRIKSRKLLMGDGNNRMLAQQELLSGIKLILWLDSSEEQKEAPTLEERTTEALQHPERVERFGGLSLGESTHLVDEVKHFTGDPEQKGQVFLLADRGQLTLPVWVDHVGSANTRYVTGEVVSLPLVIPDTTRLPKIEPLEQFAPHTKSSKRKRASTHDT
jgi:CRISPR-associated protein Cas5t